MLVYINRNYSFPDTLRQTPGGKGVWNNVHFTFDDCSEADYAIVINHPSKNIRIRCRKGGKWLFLEEPPYSRNEYLKDFFPFFDKVFSLFNDASTRIVPSQTTLPWHINKSYDELMAMNEPLASEKEDALSWVTSNSNMNPGHEPRLNFLKKLKDSDLDLHLFGRGFSPIADKFDGVYPYRYSLAVENFSGKDYFTEKIADVFLSWSMPVYYGCTNILDYFPERSMILIDINDPERSFNIIKEAIASRLWEKNLPYIREARRLILNEYQFFPAVVKMISEDQKVNPNPSLEEFTIPVDPYSNASGISRVWKKLTKVFG